MAHARRWRRRFQVWRLVLILNRQGDYFNITLEYAISGEYARWIARKQED